MRILIAILAALIVAGGAGFYVMQGLKPSAPAVVTKVEAPKPIKVFVPAKEISVGTILTREALGTMDMAPNSVTDQMVVADGAGELFLKGSVARQVLPQGVPVARSAIVQPGDGGFLAAVLPRGKRAVTIAIGEVAGVGGLVQPGDRVDIILTYSVGGGANAFRASETVLGNIRILALDQRLGAGKPDPDKKGKADKLPMPGTATIEVTPAQAEKIALASNLGSMSLALNSVRESDTEATTPMASGLAEGGFDKAVQRPEPRRLTLESDVTSTSKVKVVRGVKKVRSTPTTGGDAAADPADAPAPAE